MMSGKTVLGFLVAGGLFWIWLEPVVTNTVTTYRATCANEIVILPETAAYISALGAEASEGMDAVNNRLERIRKDRENCLILPMRPTTYKINEARAEAYYTSELSNGPRRLTDCLIYSREEWSCSYPDGSGRVVVLDGIEAIQITPEGEAAHGSLSSFALRPWQYWATKLYWWVGKPSGDWLIPEQRDYRVES